MQSELTYGWHAVQALLQGKTESISQILLQRGRRDQRIKILVDHAQSAGVRIRYVDKAKLDKLTDNGKHQGIVACRQSVAVEHQYDLQKQLDGIQSTALILVLDGITDPHNLGACLRVANGAGVDFVLAPKHGAASVTPVVSKVASGAAEATPLIQVSNLSRALQYLQTRGVWLVGLAESGDNSLFQTCITGPTAIVVGAEGKGLRKLTQKQCDQLVAIPMAGIVPSLNVSVATGICLYEVVRQRQRAASATAEDHAI